MINENICMRENLHGNRVIVLNLEAVLVDFHDAFHAFINLIMTNL